MTPTRDVQPRDTKRARADDDRTKYIPLITKFSEESIMPSPFSRVPYFDVSHSLESLEILIRFSGYVFHAYRSAYQETSPLNRGHD